MNIAPGYSLAEWKAWWNQFTNDPVIWAQDIQGQATTAFNVNALGMKVIVDRDGHIVYRNAGVTGYDALEAAVLEAL